VRPRIIIASTPWAMRMGNINLAKLVDILVCVLDVGLRNRRWMFYVLGVLCLGLFAALPASIANLPFSSSVCFTNNASDKREYNEQRSKSRKRVVI
jgi:hypothetical protein